MMWKMNKNRLGNFIEGNNSLAFLVAKEVVSGSLRYNPVYFYGKSGCGKSLLLKSIEEELRNKYPEKKIIHWDSEDYVNTFVKKLNSKERGGMYHFKKRNRSADILIFDDFSFLLSGNKSSSLQSFFQMLTELYMQQKQIIIAGHVPPKDMDIDPRYKSRLAMGLVCGLERPNEITRLEIVKKLAVEKNIFLEADILEYIAVHVENAGALSGAINKIAILDTQQLNRLDVKSVRDLLEDIIVSKKLNVQDVIDVVSEYYNILPETIIAKNRSRNTTLLRQIVMFISMEKVPEVTYKIVAEALERDRSTIIHGVHNIEKLLASKESVQLKKDIQIIRKMVEELSY